MIKSIVNDVRSDCWGTVFFETSNRPMTEHVVKYTKEHIDMDETIVIFLKTYGNDLE